MNTRDKYYNDAQFHTLVDTMVQAIVRCQFTPSEMREAAVLASILYAENHITYHDYPIPENIIEMLKKMEAWIKKEVIP